MVETYHFKVDAALVAVEIHRLAAVIAARFR
jgi:hypothetical protein